MFETAIVFFIVLSILVFIHELGHYTVARLIGVKVEEFGFGLPPKIWGKTIKGTVYSINWLPIGGFVRLAGEDEDPEEPHPKVSKAKKKQYFWARSKKERGAILLAGVTMNFLLAVCITTFLLTQGIYETKGRIHIDDITAGSPAEMAGLVKQDIITRVASVADSSVAKSVVVPKDLIDFVKVHTGEQLTVSIVRSGTPLSVTLIPRTEYPKGDGPMGVAVSDLELVKYPLSSAPFVAVKVNVLRARDMVTGLGTLIVRIVHREPIGDDVAGPIGIAKFTGQAVKFGWKAVLEFMSILSLNLAVINVLPFPALDGGRLLFVFAEKFLGRKIRPAFERSTHQIGMMLLLILIVLISINDILKLARGG